MSCSDGLETIEGKKLLTYTSDTEITGSPVVTLSVSSTTPDAAFRVYLEDVAADGTVTYITEGMLRAINLKVSTEEPPYGTAWFVSLPGAGRRPAADPR